MRDLFYGDDRDLVKWGVLLKLAERFGAARILQVAYFRHEGRWAPLEIDGQECPMPGEVIRHFRDIRDIRRLNCLGFRATEKTEGACDRAREGNEPAKRRCGVRG